MMNVEIIKKTVEELIRLQQEILRLESSIESGNEVLTEEEQRDVNALSTAVQILQYAEGLIPTKTEFVYRVVFKVSYYQFFYDFASVEEAAEFAKTVMLHQVPSPDNKSGNVYVRIEVLTSEEAERKKREEEDDDE